MIRRPPRYTLRPSSAASDVYKRQHTHTPFARDSQHWKGEKRISHVCFIPNLFIPESSVSIGCMAVLETGKGKKKGEKTTSQ